MGRHVVRPLVGVPIDGVSVGDQTLKKCAQIDLDVGVSEARPSAAALGLAGLSAAELLAAVRDDRVFTRPSPLLSPPQTTGRWAPYAKVPRHPDAVRPSSLAGARRARGP